MTGEPIGNNHRMSVVMGLIDPESMRHTAAFSGANMRADVLQKKVIEFASLMSTSSAKGIDAMDLGRLQGQRKEATAPRRWADEEDEEWEDPWLAQDWGQEATPGGSGPVLAAVGTKRHKRGGIGHYSNQRPSGGGGKKGKPGGKQPYQKGQGPGNGARHGPRQRRKRPEGRLSDMRWSALRIRMSKCWRQARAEGWVQVSRYS